MTKFLHLGDLRIPITDYASQGNAILGIRDSGKSYTATWLAERLLEHGIPFVAFDPIGIWKYLRVAAKGKGYPIIIAGGRSGDLPLTPQSAPEIVRAAMRENLPLVLDLYSLQLSKADWKRIVEQSVRLLLYENGDYGLRHIFIEEAAEFCLSIDTEVLTIDGWMRPEELKKGQLVVGFDHQSQQYRYEPIERVIWRDHDGEMIPLKTARLDALVTPDHRVVIKRWQHDPKRYKLYDWTYSPASDLPYAFYIPNGGAPIGEGIPKLTNVECRILGWIITDGWRHSRDGRGRNYLCLEQSTATTKCGVNICAEMEKVLSTLGVKSRKRDPRGPKLIGQNLKPTEGKESRVWFLGDKLSKALLNWLSDDIHSIPRKILVDGSLEQLKALWDGLMEGDGTSQNGRWRYFYAGHNEELADDVQELATKLGIRSIKRLVPQNNQYRLSIADQQHHFVRRRTPVRYSGRVWDITVPSGAFVARRNGTVFVTGNCPQRVGPDQGAVYAEIEKLARMGGNALLGYTLINQRAEEVNKAVLELCDCLFLHRQKGRNSLTALTKWLDIGDVADSRPIIQSLPKLPQGECWIWASGSDTPVRVRVPEKNTFHPDRRALIKNPTLGKGYNAVDVSAFVQQMAGTLEKVIAESQANDPAHLRRQLAEAQRQLKQAQTAAPAPQIQRIEVPVLSADDYRQLAEVVSHARVTATQLQRTVNDLQQHANRLDNSLKLTRTAPPAARPAHQSRPSTLHPPLSTPTANGDDTSPLLRGERAILQALARCHPMRLTLSQIGRLSSQSLKSSSFKQYVRNVKRKWLIEESDNEYSLTPAGMAAAEFVPQSPQTSQEKIEMWRSALLAGERAIFDYVHQSGPEWVHVDTISAATGQSLKSSSYKQYLRNLKRNGLFDSNSDHVRVSQTLFT